MTEVRERGSARFTGIGEGVRRMLKEDPGDNGFRARARARAVNLLDRLALFSEISAAAEETLRSRGFDPEDFLVEPDSWSRFLTLEASRDGEAAFNGPWYDAMAGNRLVRLATQADGHGGDAKLSMELFRIGEGDDAWEVLSDGAWVDDGPPEDFFDCLLFPDALEDDGDEWPQDRTIAQMNLSVDVYNALDAAGIDTVDDLAMLKKKTALALLGPKGLEEAEEALAMYGLELE